MQKRCDKPLIVQSDLVVLLDEGKADAGQAREKLVLFADAVRRAGAIHTYRITPLTLWNAASSGMDAEELIAWLASNSRYELPLQAESMIRRLIGRYGKLWLSTEGGKLLLHGSTSVMDELTAHESVIQHVKEHLDDGSWHLDERCRGVLKQELTRLGYPVIDRAGYHAGEELELSLRLRTISDRRFELRDYQQSAVEQFYKEGTVQGGSGVLVLPCGAGKTIVGIAAMARLGRATLILTSNATSVKQWKDELLDKTSLQDSEVGQYGGTLKQVRPVTIATYHILTHRKSKSLPFTHMKLFTERDWGLIIYDEVHLLPAPVFRMTAEIQATRRLGLTATLVREDGCAEDVYSLIGPKQYDLQWKTAEAAAHIAAVACAEIRVPMHSSTAAMYVQASTRSKLRLAAENPAKTQIVEQLLQQHVGKPTLIIGQYLNQLHLLAAKLGVPLLTGEVPQEERQTLYGRFKAGELSVLIVSKIANFAVDLPDAAVAIQLSGSFGSRQEEAQRIGRLLRPKAGNNQAWFYTIVTDETKETEFGMKRQLFMLEQGYHYERLISPIVKDAQEEATAQ
ncbi:DNA repair helicase XPB [Paenibacillus sinopodophylli]|uniref:DNA repair helicase XPB n=1 Tax=Paenibacillus sinopodophylli TaxID=1837342 RepID=UPI00110D1AEB|nr:DNA repair helicase XPB [Paenibacillus sinopodophylli]